MKTAEIDALPVLAYYFFLLKIRNFAHYYSFTNFYARQLYRQVLLRARISYGNYVRPSVLVSRPGTE